MKNIVQIHLLIQEKGT